jgi:hypothetical protein
LLRQWRHEKGRKSRANRRIRIIIEPQARSGASLPKKYKMTVTEPLPNPFQLAFSHSLQDFYTSSASWMRPLVPLRIADLYTQNQDLKSIVAQRPATDRIDLGRLSTPTVKPGISGNGAALVQLRNSRTGMAMPGNTDPARHAA